MLHWQTVALRRACVAFLHRWEAGGGCGERSARAALRKVFQFESVSVLDQAIAVWLHDHQRAASGGEGWTRTTDAHAFNVPLYQLSYLPISNRPS